MPRINVTERDLSWYYRQRTTTTATVYLPGLATFGPSDPTLCDSSNFSNLYGTTAVGIAGDFSYGIAASFVKAGFNVLFHRIIPEGAKAATMELGDDTNKITITAKHPGSFGNKLELTFRSMTASPTSGQASIFIHIGSVLVEKLFCNFTDPLSSNYYTAVNSDYIDIEVVGDATKIEFSTAIGGSTAALTGGLDYTEGKTALELRQEVWSQLTKDGFLTNLEDPYQYDIDVIVNGGFALYDDGLPTYGEGGDSEWAFTEIDKVDKALHTLAVNRGTSIYLVDGKPEWSDDVFYQYCGLFDSSYVAAFGPWGQAQLLSTGVVNNLPGSYAMVVAWAQSVADGIPLWMAPAGVKRSQLGSFYKDTAYYVGRSTLDMWQNHNYSQPGQYGVNPIMKAKQYGYVIYGNNTLLQTKYDGMTSVLQSFSTRVLCNLIKIQAFDTALQLQFDQLTGDLFTQFKTILSVYLDQLTYQGALYDYEIVLRDGALTSANLNEKTLPVLIRVSPYVTAEIFDITLEITQSGVTFNEEATDEDNPYVE